MEFSFRLFLDYENDRIRINDTFDEGVSEGFITRRFDLSLCFFFDKLNS